jgi:hypothetical protein
MFKPVFLKQVALPLLLSLGISPEQGAMFNRYQYPAGVGCRGTGTLLIPGGENLEAGEIS